MSILVTDTFNRADANSLGAGWTDKRNALGIFSNQADITATADENITYYSGISWPNDGYAQATCAAAAVAGRTMQVGYRIQPGADAVRSGYYGGTDYLNHGSTDLLLAVWNVSTPTFLATDPGTVLAANDVLKLTIVGTLLTLYVNGVQKLQATDSLWASGNAGLFAGNGAIDVALLDNFEGGDFGVPVAPQTGQWASGYQAVRNLDEVASGQPPGLTGGLVRVLETSPLLPSTTPAVGGQGVVTTVETQVMVASAGTGRGGLLPFGDSELQQGFLRALRRARERLEALVER